MVCIRSVNIDDLEQLYKIEQRCFPQAEAASKEVLLQRLERFSSHFFLLEEQGRPVGMVNGMVTHSSVITDSMYDNACLHQEEGEWQTVFGLDVLPQYRCRGYGGQLMQHLVTHAKEQGRKGCILTCKQGLIPYYQRLGYQQEGVSQSIHGRCSMV